MIALQLGLLIFVIVFVAAALVIFSIRQGKADQEMRLARLEHKVNALLAHFGLPDDV